MVVTPPVPLPASSALNTPIVFTQATQYQIVQVNANVPDANMTIQVNLLDANNAILKSITTTASFSDIGISLNTAPFTTIIQFLIQQGIIN